METGNIFLIKTGQNIRADETVNMLHHRLSHNIRLGQVEHRVAVFFEHLADNLQKLDQVILIAIILEELKCEEQTIAGQG